MSKKKLTNSDECEKRLLEIGFRLAKDLRGRASHPEVLLLKMLKKLNYNFKFQHPIVCRKKKLYIMDFYFPNLGVAIECQSIAFHSSKEQVSKDKKRKRLIEKEGVQILYLYAKQIEILTLESLLQIMKIAELIRSENVKNT